MHRTTTSEFWFTLLFNVVSIPFTLLLIVMIVKQSVSVRDYSTTLDSSRSAETPGFAGDTLF
ncbi:MAG: hypothetical protein ACFB16_02775 [Phormidesmis sp.]